MASNSHPVAKTTTAAIVAVSFMILYGLTNTATVVALVLAAPPIVICSPVIVLAISAMFLIGAGIVGSAALAASAAFIFYWIYGYLTDKHSFGTEKLLDRVYALWNKISGQAMNRPH